MSRTPIVMAEILPPQDDPAVTAIMTGLCRATGAVACRLDIEIVPEGAAASYVSGASQDEPSLLIQLEPGHRFRGTCRLFGAGAGPAASPAALESLRPLLEGSLLALIERCNSAQQLEVIAGILGASEEAMLLIDHTGEILFANASGDELLSLHTRQPLAHLTGNGHHAPLLHLITGEINALRSAGERTFRRSLTMGDEEWELDLVALSGPGSRSYCLAILAASRLPTPEQLHHRLTPLKVTRREADVLAHVLQGKTAYQIAEALGISEYTVKDHLKHVYGKLGISSRSQLLARVASLA
jgi:DNA-binding CsgD family transcriptional regulator